jgi:2-polyprenyl-3-methyl-5-hydroxy-6-metoxy-1,4-benzoquinol methylase
MPLFLRQRQPNLVEKMDRDHCDPVLLSNTYKQFSTINALLSKWRKIYVEEVRPRMQAGKRYTLLDIGFGGGDVALKLADWAKQDELILQITGIETDIRAVDFAQHLKLPETVNFRHCSTTDMLKEQASFDFVISNHVLHHLGERQALKLLNEAKQLASQKVIFTDIERSDMGYAMFAALAPLIFRKSFIVYDGLISIKRSFTRTELAEIIPDSWSLKRQFPFRLLLIHERA